MFCWKWLATFKLRKESYLRLKRTWFTFSIPDTQYHGTRCPFCITYSARILCLYFKVKSQVTASRTWNLSTSMCCILIVDRNFYVLNGVPKDLSWRHLSQVWATEQQPLSTWELVSNAESQPPDLLGQNLHSAKPRRWFTGTSKFKYKSGLVQKKHRQNLNKCTNIPRCHLQRF